MLNQLCDYVRTVFGTGPVSGGITDGLSGEYFYSARTISGTIEPVVTVLPGRFGAPVAVIPSPLFGASFRDGDRRVEGVVDAAGREWLIRDFEQQERDHGRVVRIPENERGQ